VENNLCIDTWNTYAGLQGYSIFTVSVAAQTAMGTGPSITVQTDRTPEGVPGAPDDIAYQIVTDTAVQLYWNPPDNPNGNISLYQVIFRPNQTASETPNVS